MNVVVKKSSMWQEKQKPPRSLPPRLLHAQAPLVPLLPFVQRLRRRLKEWGPVLFFVFLFY
jgi:hypothetical protein